MLSNRLRSIILALFHFLFLATPFVFTWINEELFEFNKMLFVYGVTTLLVGLWVVRMFVENRLLVKKTSLDLPLFLFFLSQILSTLFSIHPRTSLFGYYTRFNGGLISTVTYIALYYTFVNNVHRKQISSLLISLLLGSFFVSLYAIPEHFGHSFSCFLITGEFNTQCWVQDVQNRVFASFGQPNWLAAYTITLIPLALAQLLQKKSKKIAGFLIVVLGALFTTTLFTKSRSGQLGLGIGMGSFAIGTLFLWKSFSQMVSRFKEVLFLFLAIALIFGTTLTPSLREIFEKNKLTSLENTLQASEPAPAQVPLGGTDSGEIRKIVWKGAIHVWKRYPLFGSGVETFAYSYYQDRPTEHNLVSEWDFLYNKAHNEFLNYLATTGIVGLSTYLFFLGSYLLLSYRFHDQKNSEKSAPREEKLVVLGMASGIIALSVSNFFGFSTVMTSLFLFIFPAFLSVLQSSQHEEARASAQKKMESLSFMNSLGSLATFITVFFLLAGIYKIWKADAIFSEGKAFIQANEYITGATKIQEAIAYSPQEALFYDELATVYSQLAIAYAQSDDATTSTQLAEAAVQTSDFTLQLNNRHLNFYKTQARIFINLSQLDPELLNHAQNTLNSALELAPTDAKLLYNLGLVQISNKDIQAGIDTLLKTLELKPNYLAARLELANQYEAAEKTELAREQYQYLLDHVVPGNQEIEEKLDSLSR